MTQSRETWLGIQPGATFLDQVSCVKPSSEDGCDRIVRGLLPERGCSRFEQDFTESFVIMVFARYHVMKIEWFSYHDQAEFREVFTSFLESAQGFTWSHGRANDDG